MDTIYNKLDLLTGNENLIHVDALSDDFRPSVDPDYSLPIPEVAPPEDTLTGDVMEESLAAMPPALREHFSTMAYRTRHEVCEILVEAEDMMRGLEDGRLIMKGAHPETLVGLVEDNETGGVREFTGAHVHALMRSRGQSVAITDLRKIIGDEFMAGISADMAVGEMNSSPLLTVLAGGEPDTRLPIIPDVRACFAF